MWAVQFFSILKVKCSQLHGKLYNKILETLECKHANIQGGAKDSQKTQTFSNLSELVCALTRMVTLWGIFFFEKFNLLQLSFFLKFESKTLIGNMCASSAQWFRHLSRPYIMMALASLAKHNHSESYKQLLLEGCALSHSSMQYAFVQISKPQTCKL